MKISKLYSILSLVLAFMLSSCSDEGLSLSTYTPSLTARYLLLNSIGTSESVEFEASSNLTKSMTVKSQDTPWAFSGMDSWLQLSQTSGTSSADVSITAQENKSGEISRTNIFDFASTAADYPYSKKVTATQKYATPYITLSEQSLALRATAQETTVSVASNVSWEVSCTSDWVKVAVAGDSLSLKINVAENLSDDSRSATVYVKKGNVVSSAITITQAAATIDAQTATLNFENVGGTKSVSITSDVSWTATTSDSWLQVTPDNGTAGASDISISATPTNSTSTRTSYVYLKIGSKNIVQIKVVQAANTLAANPTSLTFESVVSSKDVEVSSNISWKVYSYPDWLTVEKKSGKITISAKDNPLTTDRTGEVVVSDDTSNPVLKATIKVAQSGKHFGDILSTIEFEDKADSKTLTIDTDGSWTAVSKDEWITVSPQSGTAKDSVITVSVAENTADEERIGSFDVTVGETTKTVVVTQTGKYFNVDDKGVASIPSKGGSRVVTFSTNCSWTAESKSNWITLSPKSGSETGELTITASDNPSTISRADTTIITPAVGQPIKIITTQAGKYLNVDTQNLYFFTKGGTSSPVTIDTDAEFEITKSDSWMTILQNGNVFTVTVSENTTDDTREGKIIVKMLGLQNGEEYHKDITVIQRAKGEAFKLIPFGEDEHWGENPEIKPTIVVSGYGEDEHWGEDPDVKPTVEVKGFDNDENWNP